MSSRNYLGLCPAFAVLLGMAAWGWGRLVETQVDFGREVYLAWQLANGKRLYTDLIYYYGPLSPYFNALLFKSLGVSIRCLLLSNLVIAAFIILVLYKLLLDVADGFSAMVACVVFAFFFACPYYLHPSIYNFLCPYSHAATHGLLLGLISVWAAGRLTHSPTLRNACLCGISVGFTFLTKPEPFVAAGIAVLVCAGFSVWQHHLSMRQTRGMLVAGFAGACSVVATAFTALAMVMPLRAAGLGVLGSWPFIRNQGDKVFHQARMGLNDVSGNLLTMLGVIPFYAMTLCVLALYIPSRKIRALILSLGCVTLPLILLLGVPDALTVLRPLPIFLCVPALGFSFWLIRHRDAVGAQATTRRLTITVFAGLLLSRIVLKTTVSTYGFVLAAPGALILIVALLSWVPIWLGASARRIVYTGAILGVIMYLSLVSLDRFRVNFRERDQLVGTGSDAFLGDAHCRFAVPALEAICHRIRPGETLCVIPEGIMINYLSRVESSVPYTCFLPANFEMYGEDKIVKSFQDHPPDYVLLVHRDTREYGPSPFGREYGRELYSWILQRYESVAQQGKDLLRDNGEGFVLMARVAPAGTKGVEPLAGLTCVQGPVRSGTHGDAEPSNRRRQHVLAMSRRVHPPLRNRLGIGIIPAAVLEATRVHVMTNSPAALHGVVLAGPGR